MAWPKSLSPVRVIEELRGKIASIQEQWRGTRTGNEQLREENEELRRRRGQLEKDRDRLRQENEELKRQLEQALRAGKRQAAPKPHSQYPDFQDHSVLETISRFRIILRLENADQLQH
jgi:phage shock protein A